MPICIHCSTPIESLYMRYGRDHIVLSPCRSSICSPHASDCSPSGSTPETAVFADEYLEHDLTVVIIDLILAKPQAYRHLLFNRSSIFTHPLPRDGQRLGRRSWMRSELPAFFNKLLALSLVDAYIRWFYLCVQPPRLALTADQSQRVSARVAKWLQQRLPIQAGMFFPSLFTPRAQTSGGARACETSVEVDSAVAAVCSATPLFAKRWTWMVEADDDIVPTLVSYANVLVVTLVEALALHLTVAILAWVATRHLLKCQPKSHLKPRTSATPINPINSSSTSSSLVETTNYTNPLIACKALLLSQFSPLMLLTFVLMWSTKLSHPSIHPNSPTPSHNDTAWMVWLLRTLLASLNAGVAIATVLPSHRTRHTTFPIAWPPFILASAWTAQAFTSYALYSLLS